MVRILAVCMLVLLACGKDNTTSSEQEPEIIFYELEYTRYDGFDAIVDLNRIIEAPFKLRIIDVLSNIEEENRIYDAKDIYSITTSSNGRVYLNLENPGDYPVPVYIWVADTTVGLIAMSHFGFDRENLPIDTTVYAQRELTFGVGVVDGYRSRPPEDPAFDFTFRLIAIIP